MFHRVSLMMMSARKVASRVGQVIAGLLVAVALAEGAFWLRDRGAFPHVNFYVPDAKLGVRLRPGATERISFGGNPVTRVRINSDGTRGAALPPGRANEILVVGDSQTFGLGVEEGETFAARLAALTGRPVVNAGVPTYGPGEYDAVVEEMLARRHPTTVVYVVNMANDLFEADRPNRDRHVVWDGWAVRKDGAAATPGWFPGRELLYGRSHLVFALRKLGHKKRTDAEGSFASEGTWTDLVGAGASARQSRERARAERREAVRKQMAAYADATQRAGKIEQQLDQVIPLGEIEVKVPEKSDFSTPYEFLAVARASVGDIVEVDDGGESSRSVAITAEMIRRRRPVPGRAGRGAAPPAAHRCGQGRPTRSIC